MKKNILLLNPPANKKLQRDFICSSSSKANYYWPPIDFIVLSGILKDHNIKVIDAVIDNRNPNYVLNFIKNKKFDYIISLCSSIDFNNELMLLDKIKIISPKTKMIVIGDIAFFEKDKVIKNKSIDAILLDFTSKEILKYINNPSSPQIKDMLYKIEGKVLSNGINQSKLFSYGKCNISLFNLEKYSLPYSMYHPIAPILINYGCPHKCAFCSSGLIGYKIREISEVKSEILEFYKKGFKELFIRDFNFTTNKEYVRELCNFMIQNKIKIEWSCEGRVNEVDSELLKLMKKAGCFLIFFGVESSKQENLDKFQKRTKVNQVISIFQTCKKIGIKTLGSFIIGLPGDTKKDILDTIKFSKNINADFASFNLYVPRYGSILRKNLSQKNDLKNQKSFDSSNEFVNFTKIPNEEVLRLHKYAIRSFYFRPSYILNKFFSIKSWSQLNYLIKNGLSLLKRAV